MGKAGRPPVREERNYGIDILKVLSMYMVVVLHIAGVGGVRNACRPGSDKWAVCLILEGLCYGAVNLFAMASGYLMVSRRFRLSRIMLLWLQVFFYSLGLTVILALCCPGLAERDDWLRGVFPVSYYQYWYFTAYFCLSFLTPFLNNLLNTVSRRKASLLLTVLFLLFSVVATITPVDVFCLRGGYTSLWLVFLYLAGGYLRKYDPLAQWPRGLCFLLFGLLSLLTGLSVYVFRMIPALAPRRTMLLRYISPTVVLGAVFLMGGLAQVRVKRKFTKKVLTAVSPLTFGVYLIHAHTMFFQKFIVDGFRFLAGKPSGLMVLEILLIALGIFLACLALEALRRELFRLLRIPKLVDKCAAWATAKLLKQPQPVRK